MHFDHLGLFIYLLFCAAAHGIKNVYNHQTRDYSLETNHIIRLPFVICSGLSYVC